MGRQILAVVAGLALSFLASAFGGYFLYHLSDRTEQQLGVLARYIINPVIAAVVGACVGAVAKTRPITLTILALIPWSFAFLLVRQQRISGHISLLFLLGLLYIVAGAVVAWIVVHRRARLITA